MRSLHSYLYSVGSFTAFILFTVGQYFVWSFAVLALLYIVLILTWKFYCVGLVCFTYFNHLSGVLLSVFVCLLGVKHQVTYLLCLFHFKIF